MVVRSRSCGFPTVLDGSTSCCGAWAEPHHRQGSPLESVSLTGVIQCAVSLKKGLKVSKSDNNLSQDPTIHLQNMVYKIKPTLRIL